MRIAYAVLIASAIIILLLLCSKAKGSHERRLLMICRGDRDQMESLIAYEMRRKPGISRAEAAKRAVESYRRDNR